MKPERLDEIRTARFSGQCDTENWRTPAERDNDRILYASAYRRLAGVTQVLPAVEQPILHNRLTHSLKVAQVARGAAQQLLRQTSPGLIARAGGLDPQAAEAAGAAHDLGHPPFGHIAESELQDLLATGRVGQRTLPKLSDSFEGNAQSLRIVTKLSLRKRAQLPAPARQPDMYGLDLSRATLAGLLKYPWVRGEHEGRITDRGADDYYRKKWGAYESERRNLEWALKAIPDAHYRSLEAEVMDWADDITYAVHDIEDFFRLGLIPLPEIRAFFLGTHSSVGDAFWDYAIQEVAAKGEVPFDANRARAALKLIAEFFPERPYEDETPDRLHLHMFISRIVTSLQRGMVLVPSSGKLDIPADGRMVVEVLKQLTWYFVIGHPALAAAQIGQRRVIRDLVEWVTDWVADNDPLRSDDDASRKRKIERRRERNLPGRLRSYLYIAEHEFLHGDNAHESRQHAELRAVIDYITSLTEVEAYGLHHRLGGLDSTSIVTGVLAR